METFFYFVTLGPLIGTIVLGLIFWLCSFIYDFHQQKKEIAYLERENLQLTRTNEALREMLYE